MTRKNPKLIFDFESFRRYYTETIECIFCQTEYPTPPVVVVLSEILANGDIPESSDFLCPACILSDAKTLAETARATVEKNRAKRKAIQAKPKAARTKDERGFLNGDEDFSPVLIEIASNLYRLGDISKIVNYDLAVVIARHYTEKGKTKAA